MLNFLPAPLQCRQWESMHNRKAERKEKDTSQIMKDVPFCRGLLYEVRTHFEGGNGYPF
jgi:hydrogenase maturation factor HypF (carbamoyltransferase family)